MSAPLIVSLYALLCLIWGSTWLAIKFSLDGIPPVLGAALRFALASTIMFLLLWMRKAKLHLTRDGKIAVISTGILAFTFNYACVYWAESYISSGLTAILFSVNPLIVAMLSRYWTKSETLTARKVAGILIGMAGTALLFWPEERLSWGRLVGIAAVLFAALSSAVNMVMVKKYARHMDVFVLNALGMAIGTACLLATSAAFEHGAHVSFSPSNLLAVAYLAVFGTVIGFLGYYRLLQILDATVVSAMILIFPPMALALGRIFLHESISPRAVAGAAVVLTGVGITINPFSRARARRPPIAEPLS